MRRTLLTMVVLFSLVQIAAQTPDAKMNTYVTELMRKMTLEEKIGQLNLVTPGWGVPTGSVVSKGVEDNIRKGRVGGLFGIFGPDKVRQAQSLCYA
jgi:beta-glucosidase